MEYFWGLTETVSLPGLLLQFLLLHEQKASADFSFVKIFSSEGVQPVCFLSLLFVLRPGSRSKRGAASNMSPLSKQASVSALLAHKQTNINYRSQSMKGWQRIHRPEAAEIRDGSGLDLQRGGGGAGDEGAVSVFEWQQLGDPDAFESEHSNNFARA